MPETTVQAPGTFCWCEVAVTNAERARKFYRDLFGWSVRETSMGDAFAYGMIQSDGREIGGMYEIPREMRAQGVPPHWMSYVAVKSVDETAAKIPGMGGRILNGPMDVMSAGRMAVLQDPTGAVFSIWEAREHPGAAVTGENGRPCWFELVTSDTNRAGAFYEALFGWKREPFLGGGYTIFRNGETSVGGMMQRTPEMGDAPSSWTIYFSVEDCDGFVRKAQEVGGRLVAGPMDVPSVGRFAVLADPDGAMFAVIRPEPAGDV